MRKKKQPHIYYLLDVTTKSYVAWYVRLVHKGELCNHFTLDFQIAILQAENKGREGRHKWNPLQVSSMANMYILF